MPIFNIDTIRFNSSLTCNSASISGSMSISSGIQVLSGITGSLLGTASIAVSITTASYVTASAVSTIVTSSFSISSSLSSTSNYSLYPRYHLNSTFSQLGSEFKIFPLNYGQQGMATGTITNNTIYLLATYVPSTTTLTGMKWYRNSTPTFNTPAGRYNGIALYTYSAGTLTLAVSSSNSSAMWSQGVVSTWISASFTSQYTATRGTYFMAFQSGDAVGSPSISISVNNQTNPNAFYWGGTPPFTNTAYVGASFNNTSADLPITLSTSTIIALPNANYVPFMILY